jgi:oxalate decarboxylase
MDVPLSGRGRLGVANPDDTFSVQEVLPGQIGFVPQGYAHYIENTGKQGPAVGRRVQQHQPQRHRPVDHLRRHAHAHVDRQLQPAEGGLAKAGKPSETLFIVEPT